MNQDLHFSQKTSTNHQLSKEQKKSVALLSVGTMLECFDVVLYIHMAVLLNDLFFPTTDARIKDFIPAFSFLSTYLMRPIGALFFGYLGDTIGRKPTIILTTIVMSLCCIVIASLPTYAQIGIAAPIILTICRMIQGSIRKTEDIGVQIHTTESFHHTPSQYFLVSLVPVFVAVGSVFSLAVGAIFTNPSFFDQNWINYSWRFAFLVGAIVGVVGIKARTTVQEAGDFATKSQMYKQTFTNVHFNTGKNETLMAKVPFLTSFYYFCIHCARPGCIYFTYVYCPEILKKNFGFTAHEILLSNFYFCIVIVFSLIFLALLSYRINPFTIVRTRLALFFFSLAFFPFAMSQYSNPQIVVLFQCLAGMFMLEESPAGAMFFKHFPVLKRFRYTAVLTALAETILYAVSAFGMTWATQKFGYSGIFLIFVPTGILFALALRYFESKEFKVVSQSKKNI
jgi:MFS family permease